MSDAVLLILPVVLPMLSAALATLLRHRPAVVRIGGVVAAAALAIASLALFLRVTGGSGLIVTRLGGWPSGMGLSLIATLPGAGLVLVTALVTLAATIYGLADIGARRRRTGYEALLMALIGAVNGAFLTGDLFNLYVWFELALVAALGLITIDRRAAQIDGAIRYAVLAMLGASLMLTGIGMLYGVTGTLDMAALGAILADRPPSFATALAAALLFSGFALKAGLVPFHLWLPASYHTAPATVTAIFAALLTKMGFYALLLLFAGVFGVGAGGVGAARMEMLFGWVAAATMLLCALGALAQTDMRRILAYHVIAQVGYMMMGLAIGTAQGIAAAIFYMVHSMIVQANLFLGAGAIHRATGSWDLTRAGGMTRTNPGFALLFAVPVLSLSGIPPFSGFWAKAIVIRAGLDAGALWLSLAALVAALLTILSMAAFWSDACWKEPARGHRVRPVPFAMMAGMGVLSAATVLIGLTPEWLWTLSRLSARALAGMSGGGA